MLTAIKNKRQGQPTPGIRLGLTSLTLNQLQSEGVNFTREIELGKWLCLKFNTFKFSIGFVIKFA